MPYYHDDDIINPNAVQPVNPLTELPIASADTLGGVKVGDGLAVTSDGTLSASGGGGVTVVEYEVTSDGSNVIISNVTALCDALDDIYAHPEKAFSYGFVCIWNGSANATQTANFYNGSVPEVILTDIHRNGINAEAMLEMYSYDSSGIKVYCYGSYNTFVRSDITAQDTVELGGGIS